VALRPKSFLGEWGATDSGEQMILVMVLANPSPFSSSKYKQASLSSSWTELAFVDKTISPADKYEKIFEGKVTVEIGSADI